ncbi:hypothetical protein HW555_013650 [Spodoptera exigua]|uniref:Peptidase A2 domain-containing protein n=1 Tax=Spodoptera exigua TaxID=7107 RepID=A0A835G4Y9_SPOEX|nr:hypothetical protein HW555_013650 [Spodoptera exigua]
MPELSSVSTSLRIPPIWRDKIRLWFAQFEAIMSPQKKGDQAMFELVVGHLERQDLDEISDIILHPPERERYEALKNRLLQVYEESEQRQVQRLLSEMELGDLKPSQLLRRMKNLAADNISDAALRIMWTNHLPQSVRAVLAVSDNIAKYSDIHDLAMMADKILEQTQPHGIVAAVAENPIFPRVQASIEDKIDMLTREIAELRAAQSSHPALDEAGTGATTTSYRLFITDRNSRLSFLIDTGANVSVIPRRKGVKVAAFTATTNTHVNNVCECMARANLAAIRVYNYMGTYVGA